MVVLLLLFLPLALSNKSIEYLSHYGYISDSAVSESIEPSVKLFQETFGLETTGILDNATLELMERPRCGNTDELLPFVADPNKKWTDTEITWYMYNKNQYDNIVHRAFNLWSKHANITFRRESRSPTIIMSFSTRKHVFYARHDMCHYDFDGPGLILAHAYMYDPSYNQTDIHFDIEEKWDFSMDLPGPGKVSFYLTAVHEIGHVLGLGHSYVSDSVMYPVSRVPKGIADLYEYDLSKDDIFAIQFMYGKPPEPSESNTTTSTTTSTTTTTTTTEAPIPVIELDICSMKRQVNTFLVVNRRIFAFYRDYVWIFELDPEHRTQDDYIKPRKITDWLTFLPKNFNYVSAIYQRSDGTIVMFADKDVYYFRYPSLILSKKTSVDTLLGRKVNTVNAAFVTNQGKTYVIIDDWYLLSIDECSYTATMLGITSTTLHGIPNKIKGAFRYINGKLYFITDSNVLEYSEFTNTVTSSDSDVFDTLQFTCIKDTVLRRLHDVLRYFQ